MKEVTQLGVPEGSATILIEVYLALRRGAVFKRALSEADMDRFLRGIAEDDKADALALALNAFARHISYRESIGNAQPGNRALYAKHLAKVSIPDRVAPSAAVDNDSFAEEVLHSRKDSAAKRQERLRAANRVARRVPKVIFVFERNPDVVAEALERANGVYGICKSGAPFFRANDGSPYLEVHRVPLAKGGEDTVENAGAVCPNCHREQHYG